VRAAPVEGGDTMSEHLDKARGAIAEARRLQEQHGVNASALPVQLLVIAAQTQAWISIAASLERAFPPPGETVTVEVKKEGGYL
jgi:hypothetical protein